MIAFDTAIAEPDREGGALRYRGVDIEELVGKVRFESDFSDVQGVPPGGSFILTESDAVTTRRIEIRSDDAGRLTRKFTVDGVERPWDDEGRRWLKKAFRLGDPKEVKLLALADPPTALFAGNNIMALGIVAELARSKRKDVAVVAFDDVSLAEALEPALTVVAQDPEELGRTAAAGMQNPPEQGPSSWNVYFRTPDAEALVWRDVRWTYRELAGRAAALAVASLPGCDPAADLSAADRYFERDNLITWLYTASPMLTQANNLYRLSVEKPKADLDRVEGIAPAQPRDPAEHRRRELVLRTRTYS